MCTTGLPHLHTMQVTTPIHLHTMQNHLHRVQNHLHTMQIPHTP